MLIGEIIGLNIIYLKKKKKKKKKKNITETCSIGFIYIQWSNGIGMNAQCL